jgi:hypothetical protein
MAMAKLRRMAALSLTFRTLVAAQMGLDVTDDAEEVYQEAFSRMFYEYVPGADENVADGGWNASPPVMPFGSIWPMSIQRQAVAYGERAWMWGTGQLALYLATQHAGDVSTWNDQRLQGVDLVDGMTADIANLSEVNDDSALGAPAISGESHLAITIADAQITDHVPFKIRQSAGNYFWRSIMVTYGVQG